MKSSSIFILAYGIFVAFILGMAYRDVGTFQQSYIFGGEHVLMMFGVFIIPFIFGMIVEHLRIKGD